MPKSIQTDQTDHTNKHDRSPAPKPAEALLDFNAMRRERLKRKASTVDDDSPAAVWARLQKEIEHEESFAGVVMLLTFAHLDAVSVGFPKDIPLGDKTAVRSGTGIWKFRVHDGQQRDDDHLFDEDKYAPERLAWRAGEASGADISDTAMELIEAACLPLKKSDGHHVASLLDRIPPHSLAHAMGYGPYLFRQLAGIDTYRKLTAAQSLKEEEFARQLGDALIRRKVSLHCHTSKTARNTIKNHRQALGVPDEEGYKFPYEYPPMAYTILGGSPFASQLPFIREAIRAGWDINLVSGGVSMAGCGVLRLNVENLKELQRLGLDFTSPDIEGIVISKANHHFEPSSQRVEVLRWLVDDLNLVRFASREADRLETSLKEYEPVKELDRDERKNMKMLTAALEILRNASPEASINSGP